MDLCKDALQKIVLDEQKALRSALKEDDELTHNARARDRDEDLDGFFISQHHLFEQPCKDDEIPDKWACDGVRIGVLRRIKSFVQVRLYLQDIYSWKISPNEQEYQVTWLIITGKRSTYFKTPVKQDAKEDHASGIKVREQEILNNQLLQEIGDYTPINSQNHGDNFR